MVGLFLCWGGSGKEDVNTEGTLYETVEAGEQRVKLNRAIFGKYDELDFEVAAPVVFENRVSRDACTGAFSTFSAFIVFGPEQSESACPQQGTH